MFLDLHRHLEGSHSPQALARVARQFDVRTPFFVDPATNEFRSPSELSTELTMGGPSDDASLFYRCIVLARQAYVSVEAIGALAVAAFEEAAADTDGFEMRLSLFSMTRTLLENQKKVWREVPPVEFAQTYARPVLLAVLGARDTVAAKTKKPMVVRLGLSRTFESEAHYRAMADMVAEHAKALVGLDILGIVPPPDTEPLPKGLVSVLEGLRRHLPDLTVHAGEFDGHASIDRTLALEPRGIGHGVHALESRATLERLATAGVTVEVCPTSNRLLIPTALGRLRQLHAVEPLVAFQHAHVHCVLGSDDPTPMGTSFKRELEKVKGFGADLARLEADMLRRWEQMTGTRLG